MQREHGKGAFLGGTLGSSVQGTHTISDNYEAVPFITQGKDGNTKYFLLEYLKNYSRAHPQEIVSIKDFPEFPVVMQAIVKNAVLYGIKFDRGVGATEIALDLADPSNSYKGNIWSYKPLTPSSPCHTENFNNKVKLPNQKLPIEKNVGSIAARVTPAANSNMQTVVRMYNNDNNDLGIYYDANGAFRYEMKKDGIPFASMLISPPSGKTFANKEVILTFEAVKTSNRKYDKSKNEQSAIFRVACPSIGFNQTVQQDILWSWKHEAGSITPADSANARGNAYLEISSFVAGMDKITVGAKNSACGNPFRGSINQVEVTDKLPTGSSDFWSNASSKNQAFVRKDNLHVVIESEKLEAMK